MCGSGDLISYLDLGHTARADSFVADEKLGQSKLTYPLNVLVCGTCGLSQPGFFTSRCKSSPERSLS